MRQIDHHIVGGAGSSSRFGDVLDPNNGGVQAQAIMQRLREGHLSTELLRAEPKTPLPPLELAANVTAQLPPLLKAYMRLGAKICGEPCWDEDFQVADVFILLKRDELCPRYARHFKAAM